jgi:nucleoside-diphosphate-sugar epimerase
VYVADAVDALLKLAFATSAESRLYNVASGNVVVEKMVAYVKTKIPDAGLSYAPVRDIMRVVAWYREWTIDCARAERELGWRPSYGIDRMVDDIIAHVRKRKDA